MKKPYMSPTIEMESFMLNQQIASCSVIQISFTNSECVLKDPDSTGHMKDLAMAGFFFEGCSERPIGSSEDDGICYHTSMNMAFTS